MLPTADLVRQIERYITDLYKLALVKEQEANPLEIQSLKVMASCLRDNVNLLKSIARLEKEYTDPIIKYLLMEHEIDTEDWGA
jgi:hypothetical protein